MRVALVIILTIALAHDAEFRFGRAENCSQKYTRSFPLSMQAGNEERISENMERKAAPRFEIFCRRCELEWVISIDSLRLAMQVEGPDLKSALRQWVEYLEDFHAVLAEDADSLGSVPAAQLAFLHSVGIHPNELE